MRFVPPAAALSSSTVSFDGDPHMRSRPIGEVLAALRTLGVEVVDEGRGALPFEIRGTGSVPGGRVVIDASASSQFVSALLLAGARYDDGVDLRHDGKPVPSLPHIDMTVAILREHGVEVDDSEANRWAVAPGVVKPVDHLIEPDLSNAAPFLAAALVTGGSVTVPHWPAETDQPGSLLPDLLTAMGGQASLHGRGLTVTGSGSIAPLVADLHQASELTPVLAALAALADGESRITGVAHIRGHETDRLAALRTELAAIGAEVTETADGLLIRPGRLRPALWHAYADHRMAQAGALLGLAVPGLTVDDIGCTSKTMAGFPELWAALLGQAG